jgi:dTDP-4-dehydrorhamnose reductase
MTKILVTGADGQLGSEIKVISPDFKHFQFYFTDVSSLDISKPAGLEDFFANNPVDYIINCAAYTQVDKAESDIEKARLLNVDAVGNLAQIAVRHQCRLIHISTDYVFDSSGQNIPFKENDPVMAKSVYGTTKLLGEEQAKKAEKHLIIRTSWLYSSFGHNFVKTIMRLAGEREELSVVFDQVGTPCYAADLANAILTMIEISENTETFKSGIYHYSNEGVCSWYDFAVEIVKKAGLNCTIKPIETKDYPLPAKRPAYSVMNKAKIKETYGIEILHWTISLDKCIKILSTNG